MAMNGTTNPIGNDNYMSMMKGYIDTTKGVMQLALASLMLPIFFLRQIVGVSKGESLAAHINFTLIGSWLLLLISVGLGLIYQFIASNRIEQKLDGTWKASRLPSFCFRGMALTFFLGVATFLWWAGQIYLIVVG